jgi:hypothetical protein
VGVTGGGWRKIPPAPFIKGGAKSDLQKGEDMRAGMTGEVLRQAQDDRGRKISQSLRSFEMTN